MPSTIQIERSKKGLPCLWESGGGMTNTGNSTIISDPYGKKKHAIYIKRSGHLSCGKHALIPVSVGDVVICASHHRDDFFINVYKIINIQKETAEMQLLSVFSKGEWSNDFPEFIYPAVQAAIDKASAYHCRSVYYAIEKENKIIPIGGM